MHYDPEQHHRRSIRLKGYDYSQAGAYFVTICAQGRACLFGEIMREEMHPSVAGRMVERWWLELNRKYPTVQTDEYRVMPNHFHSIVLITAADDAGVAPTLGAVMDWFKTMTTNEYIRGVKTLG